MKKKLTLIGAASLGMAAVSGAATTVLNLPATENNTTPSLTASTPVVTADGATFDISYTVTAVSSVGSLAGADGDEVTYVTTNGTNIGIGAVDPNTSLTAGTLNTLPQIDANANNGGNGLAFTNLTISNFMAGSVVQSVGDISNLQFDTLSVADAGDFRDRIFISWVDFDQNANNTNNGGLQGLVDGSGNYTFDLSALATQPAGLASEMYIEPSSGHANNELSISGLSVSYDLVPEPSSVALLGLGGVAALLRRRKN